MIVGSIFLVFILCSLAYYNFNPQFGGSYNKEYEQSNSRGYRWNGKRFKNLERANIEFTLSNLPSFIASQFRMKKIRSPQIPLKVQEISPRIFETGTPLALKFIWFGHSVLLFQINGKNILLDPMFGPDTTPVGPLSSKRFSKENLEIIDQLPKIDLVLFTHDHYDHLDYESMKLLKSKVNNYLVPLGFSRHLKFWGIPDSQIKEVDWWEETLFHEIKITFTPSRHYSGRGLFDRAKSLWGGWVFQSKDQSIYVSGDGGYGKHFKEVGEKFGPFDWGFMESGQYNKRWHKMHMYPEEAIQAAKDSKVKLAIPIHWGAFELALHPWKEPVERFVKEADKQAQEICLPELGEMVEMKLEPGKNLWFEEYE